MKNLNNKQIIRMLDDCIIYLNNNIKKLERVEDYVYRVYHKRNASNIDIIFDNINNKRIRYHNEFCDIILYVNGEYIVDYDHIVTILKKSEIKKEENIDTTVSKLETPIPTQSIKNKEEKIFKIQNKKNQIFEMSMDEIYKEIKFSENFNREFKNLKIGEEMYNFDYMLHFIRIK